MFNTSLFFENKTNQTGIASLVSVLLISRFVDPGLSPAICIFEWLTKTPCMFCGLTRAFHAIMHGEWSVALDFHPLAFVAFGLVLFHLIIFIVQLMFKIEFGVLKKFTVTHMIWVTFGVFVLVWAYRLLFGLL